MTFEQFRRIFALVTESYRKGLSTGFPEQSDCDCSSMAESLNNAFIIALSGDESAASEFLNDMKGDDKWGSAASYYLGGLSLISAEIERCSTGAGAEERYRLAEKIIAEFDIDKALKFDPKAERWPTEDMWRLFFPEGVGIKGHEQEKMSALREKRKISALELNPNPITDPAREVLFTSNALLTIPSSCDAVERMQLSGNLKQQIRSAMNEPQQNWYDHPIPLDVSLEANEVVYGLRGLENMLKFERTRGNTGTDQKLVCVLSVSVTHSGLAAIAREYLQAELAKAGGTENVDVYVFTEDDTRAIYEEIIVPAIEHYVGKDRNPEYIKKVFGVDGAYGRHYSFLKAVAVFWNVLINPEIKATFKIDLDQVFPQEELVAEGGGSAFDHFKSSLWGAHGCDSWGNKVELGMIAGSLVNEKDIGKSLYTADAVYPDRDLKMDELFFFSTLPHAFSTEAELLTRYNTKDLDGNSTCMQRVHVTGGTNGILVDGLMRYRPFTPTFFGRAEDQAYVMSVLMNNSPVLGYVHKDGLIMRHDKEAFAQEAIKSAFVGRAIGDYIRILYFSEYAKILTGGDIGKMKEKIDPFTGCFVSNMPVTISCMRFALKAVEILAGNPKDGIEYVKDGARRMKEAMEFTSGDMSLLRQEYERERDGWNLFYDVLALTEKSLSAGDSFALGLKRKAEKLVDSLKAGA